MHRDPRKPAALLAVTALLAALVAACGGGSSDTPTSSEPQTIQIPTRWASANAADLPSLIQFSDEIFVGRVTRAIGQTETEIVPGASGRGKLPLTTFEVAVTRAIRGTVATGAAVTIEQIGGSTGASGGAQATLVLEGDELLENGGEYLFFAAYKPNGNLSVPPFGRLQVAPDGSLEPLAHWSNLGALKQLTGLSPSQAAAKVGAAR